MPIKGLTDRGVAFPQIGNIRKGTKKEPVIDKATGKPRLDQYGNPVMMQGKDLPYFRVEFDEREVKAIARFNQLYPDGKPVAITVLLPFDDIERVWNPWREAYTAGALLHRCDGEYINYAINPATGEIVIKNGLDANGNPVKCDLKDNPDKRKRCKPTGRLSVIIPELERLAYLIVHTTSIWDIAHISEQLAGAKEVNGKHIAGIPFILRRKWYQISTPDDKNNGKRIRRPKCLIDIEPDPEWVSRKLGAMKLASMPQLAQIAAPVDAGPSLAALSEYDDDEDDEAIEEQVIDGEVTEGTPAPTAPSESPQPRKTYRMAHPVFNGMTIDQWHERCAQFAAKHDNWLKDGKPDMNHILASAGHAGFDAITGSNIDEVFAEIVAAHEQKAQA